MQVVQKAYEVAARCSYLPQLVHVKLKHSGTFVVEYKPIGYPLTVESEEDLRNVARCVCEALRVLHRNDLVHRDIRSHNIVQIS